MQVRVDVVVGRGRAGVDFFREDDRERRRRIDFLLLDEERDVIACLPFDSESVASVVVDFAVADVEKRDGEIRRQCGRRVGDDDVAAGEFDLEVANAGEVDVLRVHFRGLDAERCGKDWIRTFRRRIRNAEE